MSTIVLAGAHRSIEEGMLDTLGSISIKFEGWLFIEPRDELLRFHPNGDNTQEVIVDTPAGLVPCAGLWWDTLIIDVGVDDREADLYTVYTQFHPGLLGEFGVAPQVRYERFLSHTAAWMRNLSMESAYNQLAELADLGAAVWGVKHELAAVAAAAVIRLLPRLDQARVKSIFVDAVVGEGD